MRPASSGGNLRLTFFHYQLGLIQKRRTTFDSNREDHSSLLKYRRFKLGHRKGTQRQSTSAPVVPQVSSCRTSISAKWRYAESRALSHRQRALKRYQGCKRIACMKPWAEMKMVGRGVMSPSVCCEMVLPATTLCGGAERHFSNQRTMT